jgi:tetratricopeptide (TPR) repeat protein
MKAFGIVLALAALLLSTGGNAQEKTTEPADEGARLYEAGQYDEARTYYEGVLEKDPNDVMATVYMGRIAMANKDFQGATEWMDKAVALAPDSSNVHYWSAIAYVTKLQNTQDFTQMQMLVDKVKSHIGKAVELDPANVDARLFLAGFYMNAPPIAGGSMEKAKEQAELLLEYDKFRGQLFMAELHKKEKDFEKASEAYLAAADIDPENSDPYYQMGMMYQSTEEYDKAFESLEKAIEIDPDAFGALYQIGRTGVISENNLDRAIECLQLYLAREPERGLPTWANARWRLGMLYEIKGDDETARKQYEIALELNPDDENARKTLDALNAKGQEETQGTEEKKAPDTKD